MPSRLLEKLEYLAAALPMMDEILKEFDGINEEELFAGSQNLTLDLDFYEIRRYLYPEVRLVLAYSDGRRDERDVVPVFALVPTLGFKAEVASAHGLSVVQELIAELRVDDVSSSVLALAQLAKEVDMRTHGNDKQKGNRLLAQLRELLQPTAA